MSESLFTDLITPAPQVWPDSEPLPQNVDSALLQDATTRWRNASQSLRELLAGVPSIRTSLTDLLERELDLGESGAGLRFSATEAHPEQFVGFASLLALIHQRNRAELTPDRHVEVVGLDASHPLNALAPQQLLTRIKRLDPSKELDRRWSSYWAARAPGTPLSRREHAARLYLVHLEATAQVALARRSLTVDQLRPLWRLLDDTSPEPRLENQPIHGERLELVFANQCRSRFPGAWVISVGERQSAQQLLYLPHRPLPLQSFANRNDMESWLRAQPFIAKELSASGIHFEYSAGALPLTHGMSEWLTRMQEARLNALRQSPDDLPDLVEQAIRALVPADRVDHQNSSTGVLASPPPLTTPTPSLHGDESPLFGALFADIPWEVRQTALLRQQNALQAWSSRAGEKEQRALEDLLQRMEDAERMADGAAQALVYRERVLDTVAFNREFTLLHQAHKTALLAEAALQCTLGQLSEVQWRALESILENTGENQTGPYAAEISLVLHGQPGSSTREQTLGGPLVFNPSRVLSESNAPHSLLLYWPGTGGGLRQFDNRREMERELFKIPEQDAELTLHLKRISGDPLQHALNQVTHEFEEQAGTLRQQLVQSISTQRAERLEAVRLKYRSALQVPVNAARRLAASHLREQRSSTSLASVLPDWLSDLSGPDRSRLRWQIEAYIKAMQQGQMLMSTALPPREEFTRQHLHARLRKDFSVKGHFTVRLDLPDSVSMEKHTIKAPGAPGTPQKLELVPSKARSMMSLEDLAQHNIDRTPSMSLEPLLLRLGFMTVQVSASDEKERQILKAGITRDYLRRTLPELDLPNAYETLIRKVFMGSTDEPPFVNDHRRECLLEPWRLMLRLQGECARLQNRIGALDQQILEVAIDADTPSAWRANNRQIVLLPALLASGGKDTPNQGPVTLSGVSFIEEQVSATTLLYLTDSPDGQCLRRYDSLEAARKALFNLCVQEKWSRWLAGRAVQGDAQAHERRIGQAVLKHFDALIGVGERWPATTSLAAHLLDAQMGRLIQAHRSTSRSNADLYMERAARSGTHLFTCIKMALGLVPFVGTAIGLYDTWNSANQAVAAFLRGAAGDGLAEIEALLLALIDAAMDILPTIGAATGAASLTSTRQLRKLAGSPAALQASAGRKARHLRARFAGYEYPQPVFLSGLQPASAGLFRNVYRHADGDFVVRQGQVYKVELSKDSRGWRLAGNAQKTYKQPIALDEAGNWDTYFGVYGTAFEGGGAGGGNVVGHLADALDPIWPASIRQRLPRWWGDRVFRRQQQLTQMTDDLARQIDNRFAASYVTINRYNNAPLDQRPALRAAADAACIGDIELASRRYRLMNDLLPLTHGNKRRKVIECMSLDAWKVADRLQLRVHHINHQVSPLLDRIDPLIERLIEFPGNLLSEHISLHREIRVLRLEMLQRTEEIESLMRDLNRWYERISLPRDKAHIRTEVEALNTRLSEGNLLYLRTGSLLEIVQCHDNLGEVSWHFLQNQARDLRARMDRALYTQFSLPETGATRGQRNQILQDCLNTYAQFRRAMTVWTASYSQHFYMDNVPALLAGIEKMAERARKTLELPTVTAAKGRSSKKIFTTEDNQLLIGVEHWESTTRTRRYHLTGKGGVQEIWEQGSNGKYHLLNAPARPSSPMEQNPGALLAEARTRLERLPAYEIKVNAHARQDMLPIDLEHMMVSEADELIHRAQKIEQIDTQNPIIATLRGKATELRIRGRQIRTRQSLNSKHPTDGMLDDLIGQNAADIRKIAPLKNLGKRRDGRIDYLQEYEIRDLTQAPPKLLWYAHFHYSKATPGFHDFEKAHLKLPEHRSLTHADDPSLPYADIGKRSSVLVHFENL
ncbi:dermonecrotic toxin domain-containing protein [Pseudomonas sp. KCJK9016]|uniref:dermonecrotic toxin domain-containing protein n=1 Tax=Pseudomonas sp. KCJK9016 TaxID=3344556 RepID=UPI0039058B09